MSMLTPFMFWLLTMMGLGPGNAPDTNTGLQSPPPPCSTCDSSSEEEDVNWAEIQRRLIANGKDSIFNGV